jgi:hypothetical protein
VTDVSYVPLFVAGSPDAIGLSLGGAALWGAEALAKAGYGSYWKCANFLYWGLA